MRRRRTLALTLLAFTWAAGTWAARADDRLANVPAAEERLREAAKQARVPYPLDKVALKLEKEERTLTLLSRGRAVRVYKVALGFTPEGHKEREGDGRTPEGDYYICTRNDKSRFHLFLGIAYPGPQDAKQAVADGRIEPDVAERIADTASPAQPPWSTPLGGAVGIHGKGGAASGDWTAGCIAVEDSEMDEIWSACPLGTPIRILP